MDFLYYDILICIAFAIFIYVFLKKNRKNVKKEGMFYLYRSKFGLKTIDDLVKKHRKLFNFISIINIIVAYIGMAAIVFLLASSVYKMAVMTQVIKTPPIVPLLPWIPFPGMPTLYFTIWIIMIAAIAIVHEGCHGIFARLNNIKVKSTGFGALGPILLAFVEPDEKQVVKKSSKAQISMFAAGPVGNFAFAFIMFLIITLLLNPVLASVVQNASMSVAQVDKNSPAFNAGIKKGDIIAFNNMTKISELLNANISLKPNQTVNITVNGKDMQIIAAKNPSNESMGYTGIWFGTKLNGISNILPFISSLFFWIFMANIFVGLFNLLPLPFVDGGRIFYASMFLLIKKNKKKAEKYVKYAYTISVSLIFMIFLVWVFRMLFG